MNEDKYLSIGALTRYLKAKFDGDVNLRTVFLKGEISNFKSHTSGHFYFSLKDETSKINAIMFASKARMVPFTPMDGSKVLVTGRVSVYEATGSYQIYVDEMMEDGVGNLYIAFEKLKKELAQEGLFDPKYKKPIPKIPERIGIITASTGAAIRDIISTIRRRFPYAETYLFPCLVQGEYAKEDIVKKIKQASTYDLDVLIVGRGGGSIEDMWPFNEEIVARAIFDCPIPIISAVGHEIDFTIADFVADLRAPTPTGAAEMAVPNMKDLINHLSQLQIRLNEAIHNQVRHVQLRLDHIKDTYILKNPTMMFDNQKQHLMILEEKMNEAIQKKVTIERLHLDHIKDTYVLKNPSVLFDPYHQQIQVVKETLDREIQLKMKDLKQNLKYKMEKLEVVNPLHILSKGYHVAYQGDKMIKQVSDIEDSQLKLRFIDGWVYTTVDQIEEEK